ncbi:hypothetical protein D3C85_1537220 [compost metagenome]
MFNSVTKDAEHVYVKLVKQHKKEIVLDKMECQATLSKGASKFIISIRLYRLNC